MVENDESVAGCYSSKLCERTRFQPLMERIAMSSNSVPTGDHVFIPSRRRTRKRQLSALELKANPPGTGDTKTRRKSEPPQKTGGAADAKARKKTQSALDHLTDT